MISKSRRLLSLLLAFVTVMSIAPVTPTNAAAPLPSETINNISAKYVLLYEANSGVTLYEKRGHEQAYPASTTKIMTAIIAIENCDLDEEVVVGNIVEGSGSALGLRPGEKMSLGDMLFGLMLVSGNDAARAIAEHVSGSKTNFAVRMNEYAAKIGMKNTHFENPNGLDDPNHYTTAYDMALLGAYAMENPIFREIVSTETHIIPPTNKHSFTGEDGTPYAFILENTNRLIHTKEEDSQSYKYDGATGIKTGDTPNAKRCLVASAERDNMKLIAVVFGDDENSRIGHPRFQSAAALFDYGFENFQTIKASDLNLKDKINYETSGSSKSSIALKVSLADKYLCIPKSDNADIIANADSFSIRAEINQALCSADNKLKAPLSTGTFVGQAVFSYGNQEILVCDLLTAEDLPVGIGNSTTGTMDSGSGNNTKEPVDYSWLFWILLACLIIGIVIVITALTGRSPRYKRYKRKMRRRNQRR